MSNCGLVRIFVLRFVIPEACTYGLSLCYEIGMSLQQYLKVVICFVSLTDLTKVFVKFCVIEVSSFR